MRKKILISGFEAKQKAPPPLVPLWQHGEPRLSTASKPPAVEEHASLPFCSYTQSLLFQFPHWIQMVELKLLNSNGWKGMFPHRKCWILTPPLIPSSLSNLLPWECKMVLPLGQTMWQFIKMLNMKLPYNPVVPLLGISPGKNENICSHNSLYRNICSIITHNSPKVEITPMCISGWVDLKNAVYPWAGILFSNKKEQSTDTCYDIDEPWQHYA